MKSVLGMLFCLLGQAMPASDHVQSRHVAQAPPEGCRLQIKVSGYREVEGRMQVALFDAAESFLKNPFKTLEQPLSADTAVLVFEDVPPGWYAVAVYQDKNENRQLDTNFLGWPVEPYGFSNNAQGRLGPPAFEQAKFSVQHPSHSISIELR